MSTTRKAVEVSLDETGEDAFLRLSRDLPALAEDLSGLSKAVGEISRDLVVFPAPTGVGALSSIPETLRDLSEIAKHLDPWDRARIEKTAGKLRAFQAWRGGDQNLEVPQDSVEKESVGIFLRVPPRIGSKFENQDDSSPVHATMLYVGDCTRDEFHKVVQAARDVATSVEPFGVDLTDYGEFDNGEGYTIPHMIPRSTGTTTLDEIHKKLRDGVELALGRKTSHKPGPFKSHVTLGYVPKNAAAYAGPRPTGKWKAKSLEVWGAPGGEFGRSVVGFGSGQVLRHVDATKGMGGDGAGTSSGLAVASNPSGGNFSTDDLARAGALVPAQGTKKPKKGETGGEPSKAYPADYAANLPFDVQFSGGAAQKAGTPSPKKKPDGKFLFSDGGQDAAAPGGGASEGSTGTGAVSMNMVPDLGRGPSAKNLEVPQDSGILSATIVKRAVAEDEPEEDQRTVFGIVLEPETVDSQNDIYSEDEIRESAWKFAERYQQFGLMHRTIQPGILLLETYVAPCAFSLTDSEGKKRAIKKGTWLLRVRVIDDAIWTAVKSGDLTGFSIGGSAIRRKESKSVA